MPQMLQSMKRKKKRIKVNEKHNALIFFTLKNNQFYRKTNKPEKYDRIVVFNYNAADIIEKIYNKLEHAKNSKTFKRINEKFYDISKVIVK